MGLAAEIADTLVRIEELLGKIAPLRQKAAATIQALDQTQSEYEEVVGPSDRESIRLEAAIAHARRLLAGAAVHRAVEAVEEDTEPGRPATVTPPRGWEASPEQIPETDVQAVRKRSIADHVLYFAAGENDPVVVLMNSMLTKPEQGAGEMLELIAWGDIWKAAADWESEAERLDRLRLWQRELESRLDYWNGQIHLLARDSRHALMVRKLKLTRARWRAYLSEIAREQELDNAQRGNELDVLEAECVRRQGGTALGR
jgi:hypothetical protein